MRRYLFNCDINKVERFYYDVVIVGSGAAGLYTAYNIDEGLSCAVLSKENIGSSHLAQGGIAAAINSEDSPELHFIDTLNAGAGMCDEEAVELLVNEGPKEIQALVAAEVPFDIDENGRLMTTREGGHTRNRILHCGGDTTGKELVNRLLGIVGEKPNVKIYDNVFFVDIITQDGKAVGVMAYDKGYKLYISPNIVVSSGGIGQVYAHTTNPEAATGDGIAAAIRAGAEVENMEFIQFHPTGLYKENQSGSCFLISEAVRGEGGILLNHKGERFMTDVHPMKELAPRDIVAREIFKQLLQSKKPNVFLDITHKSREFLINRFPSIYAECKKSGIDIATQPIPVCPVQHYFMGGIKANLDASTTISGLYCSGEASCTGVHGANRLASNSLLECVVFAHRCAIDIANSGRMAKPIEINIVQDVKFERSKINTSQLRRRIKRIMTRSGGIVRTRIDLEKGIEEINVVVNMLENAHLDKPRQMELYNMAIVAREVLTSALNRDMSVGAHYIVDKSSMEGVVIC